MRVLYVKSNQHSVANDPFHHTLDIAARSLGVKPRTLIHDPAQNIRSGAALLAMYERHLVNTIRSLQVVRGRGQVQRLGRAAGCEGIC